MWHKFVLQLCFIRNRRLLSAVFILTLMSIPTSATAETWCQGEQRVLKESARQVKVKIDSPDEFQLGQSIRIEWESGNNLFPDSPTVHLVFVTIDQAEIVGDQPLRVLAGGENGSEPLKFAHKWKRTVINLSEPENQSYGRFTVTPRKTGAFGLSWAIVSGANRKHKCDEQLLTSVVIRKFSVTQSSQKPAQPAERSVTNARVSDKQGTSRGEKFSIFENTDIPENDYRTPENTGYLNDINFHDCKDYCLSEKECVAFTYNKNHRKCFLKSKIGRLVNHKGAVSGVIQPKPSRSTKHKDLEFEFWANIYGSPDIGCLFVTPDNKRGLFYNEKYFQYWDLDKFALIRKFDVPDADGVVNVALSPDGKLMAYSLRLGHSMGSISDATVHVIDLETGQQLTRFKDIDGIGVKFNDVGDILRAATYERVGKHQESRQLSP